MSVYIPLCRWAWRLLATATMLTLLGCAGGPELQKADGQLARVPRGNFDHVLMHPDAPLPSISKVYVETPTVTMSRQWLREFRNDYTSGDLERIATTYARLLTTALEEGLTGNRPVALAETPEEADIIFRPTLTNVYLYTPDLGREGIVDKYSKEAGNATLDLVLVDPHSGQVLAQFVDHRETPRTAGEQLDRANRATNNRLFRRLMERWTYNLVAYLEDIGKLPTQ